MGIYRIIRKLPGVSSVGDRIKHRFECLENENIILSRQIIDNRMRLKVLKGERINILFLCHRPAVWGSMKSIYESLCRDEWFNVMIVTIPQRTASGEYDDEGVDSFFQGQNVISGYNREKNTFIDLKELQPDYVFYQQPYNVNYIPEYRSDVVSKYARICYLAYFTYMDNLTQGNPYDECYPLDFLKDVSYFFAQYDSEAEYLMGRMALLQPYRPHIEITGYPKYDYLERCREKDSDIWKHREWEGHFRVIWTPRWTTNEHCCHFFDYKDHILELCEQQQDIELVFRPHPQSWLEWEHTGEFTRKEAEQYKARYEKMNNAVIDATPEYLNTFYHSDCLVTDTSSLVPEYLLTGKPVIYCNREESTNKFQRGKGFSNALYWVESWDELEKTILMLKRGEDPLRNLRENILKKYYDRKVTAGDKIADFIRRGLFV